MADFSRMQMCGRLGAGGVAAAEAARRQPLSDVFPGTTMDDNLVGTEGGDEMRGQSGNDKLRGLGGVDDIDGGSGNDTIFGGDDGDLLTDGESGGEDKIFGDAGADTITSLGGVDRIFGGAGDDTIVISHQTNPIADAGEGNDHVTVTDSAIILIVGGEGAGEVDTLELGAGVIVLSFEAEVLGFEVLDAGTVQGDVEKTLLDFSGMAGLQPEVHFLGDNGNDTINGLIQGDLINGGADRDLLRGLGGADRIFGDSGRDNLNGGDGDDTLDGGGQDDTLTGALGNDVLLINGVVKAGGGPGDDYFDIGNASVLSDAVQGGSGRDTMEVGGNTTFNAPVFDFGKNDLEVLVPTNAIVGFGGVSHKFNFFQAELASGFTGAAIFGDTQADTIIGTRGNDTLSGSGGADELNTGGGADSVFGGAGDDRFTIRPAMGLANDGLQINGEAGSDTLDLRLFRIAATFDWSQGGQQDTGIGLITGVNLENGIGGLRGDTFVGNALGNTFRGGLGSDTMTGGLGVDRYVFDDRDSLARKPDLITDLADGDIIDVSLIDADTTTPGDQAFILGDGGFSGDPGSAYWSGYDPMFDQTFFFMDVNGDSEADYAVRFTGNHANHDDQVM